MERINNLGDLITLFALMDNSKIHRVMLDENNPEKFMVAVSGTNKPFHVVEVWGDAARQKEEIRFISDNLVIKYPMLEDTLKVINADTRVPNFSEYTTAITTQLATNGINFEDSMNRNVFADTFSVGYSQDGWDHDTTIPANEFMQAYSLQPEVSFESNN